MVGSPWREVKGRADGAWIAARRPSRDVGSGGVRLPGDERPLVPPRERACHQPRDCCRARLGVARALDHGQVAQGHQLLHEFLSVNREEIIARARAKAAARPAPRATSVELENGIPLFLTQLVGMLESPDRDLGATIARSATQYGDLMGRMGFT